MTDLLAARLQMAVSLGFHILFAVAGMAMPLLMVLAEWRFYKSGDATFRVLAVRWSKGTAVLFAVGAVSGTVLSFELGLLWPTFMEHAGPLIGMPFSLEGIAFFLEAIALGIYLYGWDRVPRAVHLGSGIVVAASGVLSGVFVVAVNAWMNTPRGFSVDAQGRFTDIDLLRAFFTPAFPTQAVHMVLAAYASIAFAVLGIHAWRLRVDPESPLHRAAIRIVLPLAIVVAPLQVLSGDFAAKHIAAEQPLKLAAAEGLYYTQTGAPFTLGGHLDLDTGQTHWGIQLPKLLSVLATGDANGKVHGLTDFERQDWPPVGLVHAAFQVMVGAGTVMLGCAAWGLYLLLMRRRVWEQRRFLTLAVGCGPLGLIAVEAGWMVTELGRQPWIISGVMRVKDAVTPMPGLVISFAITSALYSLLGLVVLVLLRRYVLGVGLPEGHDHDA